MIISIVQGFLLLMALQVHPAGQPEYLIRHFTVEDGLPVNSVNGIVQGDQGYLYFSTYDGLVRYDGYDFRTYNSGNTPGMQSNTIMGMFKSSTNQLWFINGDGSLTLKEGPEFITFNNSNTGGKVHRIAEAADGRIWISTADGISWFNEHTHMFVHLQDSMMNLPAAVMNTMNTDEGNAILATNPSGLVFWDGKKSTLLLTPGEFPIPANQVLQIKQHTNHQFWVAGEQGAFLYDLSTNRIDYRYPSVSPHFKFLNVDKINDQELVFTGSGGFYTLDLEAKTLTKEDVSIISDYNRFNLVFTGKSGERIWLGDDEVIIGGSIVLRAANIVTGYADHEGSIWVGTRSSGVYQIRQNRLSNLTEEDIPGLANIYSVIQTNEGTIWAAGYENGIFRISENGFTNWNQANSNLTTNVARFVFQDEDGTLYAGLNNEGLWVFNNGEWDHIEEYKNLFSSHSPTIEAMHRKRDQLLIGSLGPLIVYENGKFRLFDESMPALLNEIRVIRENSRGTLFMGSYDNGLIRIDGDSIRQYTVENAGLSSNSVRDIFLVSDDTLWVATQNLGLNRMVFDAAGRHLSAGVVTTADGLLDNSLHRILRDDAGYFWISSNRGVMRISVRGLNGYIDGKISELQILSFDEKDGMASRESNGGVQNAGLIAAEGEILFPNQKGITILDPHNLSIDGELQTPAPLIESISFSGSTVELRGQERIRLPKSERSLRIPFTAPNFTYEERLNFRYRMEGVHESWQSANQSRQAVLTTIPPGEHLFTVQTQFPGGEPVEKSMIIFVPPYFYETAWFVALMVLIGVGVITGGFKFRVRHLKERERKLQLRVDEQTEALKRAAEQKSRFFTGITHELKTPLSLIVGPLDELTEQYANSLPEKFKNRLSLVQRNSHHLKNLVAQILDVSRLNADATRLILQPVNIVELTRQIVGQFQSLQEQENKSLAFHSDTNTELIYVDIEAWERIIINMLSNAVKFSPRGSTIELQIINEDDAVQLKIKDEGPGIAPEYQQRIFEYLFQVEGAQAAGGTGIGLFLVKGLVEQMGGTIALNPEIKTGAEFIITLARGYSHFSDTHTILHNSPVADGGNHLIQTPQKTETAEPKRTGFSEQILVVEDNRDFRNYLKSILQEYYKVRTADEGDKALKLLEKQTPDLIISDVMMPGMNGIEFINSLRKNNRFKHLPVIFLSAKDRDADVEAGLSTGADVYLTKPIRSKMLLSQVAAILRRERILKNQSFVDSETEEPRLIQQVRELVYRQLANPSLNVGMLADALYISRSKLYTDWKNVSEPTINDFIKKLRLDEAKILLEQKGFNIQETARAVGFKDANYFSTSFKKEFGIPPSEVKP